MIEVLVVLVTGIVLIAAATLIGPRIGVAAPLVLVAVGIAASFLPIFADPHIEPDWILEGLLPPLLYSSAVSMPAMNFRREFGAIGGLSVVLVVGTSLVLGVFFMLVLPDLGFAWGVALGAIISPTDAVATSIIKKAPVSKRVVAMLDGESLLNDATALVLLRTAIVATAASFSFWGAVGTFAYSVIVAVVIGWVVGWLNLLVRKQVKDPTVNTVISFAVPFIASVPTTLLGASGLVAAVVAGVVTGVGAARMLSPQHRLSDSQNWRTVELVLEGAVFLTMGLQIRTIVLHVEEDHAGVGTAVLIAFGALAITLLVRAAYVAPLLASLARRARRSAAMRPRVQDLHERLSTPEGQEATFAEAGAARGGPGRGGPGRRPGPGSAKLSERRIRQFARRVTLTLADIEYFLREPLGWREGTMIVWAGMRGAVTVAAAQTLPVDTPQRSVLVLVAIAVAALSLHIQGGTIGPLLKAIQPEVDEAAVEARANDERDQLFEFLRKSAESVEQPPPRLEGESPRPELFEAAKRYQLAVIDAQRAALLDARDNGIFDADILESALDNLDASQIAIESRATLAG